MNAYRFAELLVEGARSYHGAGAAQFGRDLVNALAEATFHRKGDPKADTEEVTFFDQLLDESSAIVRLSAE